jgi:serine/threonine protein kinase
VTEKSTGKRYAAKEIIKAGLKKEDEVGLYQEIEILKELRHDHIIRFHGFFEEAERFFVVLELLEGGELFDRIVQKACYSEKEARDLVFILLTAIKYCHDRNVVHR